MRAPRELYPDRLRVCGNSYCSRMYIFDTWHCEFTASQKKKFGERPLRREAMSGPELVLNDCDESLPLFIAPDAGPAMPLRSLASHADASAAFARALPPSDATAVRLW